MLIIYKKSTPAQRASVASHDDRVLASFYLLYIFTAF